MSYLDDPDHLWELDPIAVDADDVDALLDELADRDRNGELTKEGRDLIFAGARGLLERGVGTAAECLATAMVWWHG